MANVGARIKQARLLSGKTQQRIAEEMGVSVQAVSQWENGRSRPDFSRFARLSDITLVGQEWLMGLEGDDDDPTFPELGIAETHLPVLSDIEMVSWFFHGFDWSKESSMDREAIEPTAPLKFDGFCIRASNDLEALDIVEGDILIFCTKIEPENGDIVAGIRFEEGRGVGVITVARQVTPVDPGPKFREKKPEAWRVTNEWADEEMVALAVLVERRSFRRIR